MTDDKTVREARDRMLINADREQTHSGYVLVHGEDVTTVVSALDRWQREADIQMGEKLAAQITLKAVCDVLNLPMVSLGNGWTEATPLILARIETIVDEAERAFRERDEARTALHRCREDFHAKVLGRERRPVF